MSTTAKSVQELEERVKILESQVQQQQVVIQDLLQQVFQLRQVLPSEENRGSGTKERTHLLNFVVSTNEAPCMCPVLKKDVSNTVVG